MFVFSVQDKLKDYSVFLPIRLYVLDVLIYSFILPDDFSGGDYLLFSQQLCMLDIMRRLLSHLELFPFTLAHCFSRYFLDCFPRREVMWEVWGKFLSGQFDYMNGLESSTNNLVCCFHCQDGDLSHTCFLVLTQFHAKILL